jgi:methionyl-tRNA formyltransferase
MKKIPLIKPYITQEVKDKVCEVLDSGYLTEGPVTKQFEDIFVVAGWYHMVPRKWRDLAPAYGLHASLLPDYSGGAPLVWAIISGEKQTGITLFQFDGGVDSGLILSQKATAIRTEDTIATLYARIEQLGLDLLRENLPGLADGSARLIPQDESNRRIFPQRAPEDGIIDWNQSAWDLHNFIRAQTRPYPGAFTTWQNSKIHIWQAGVTDGHSARGLASGQVLDNTDRLLVRTGTGALEIMEVQFEEQDITGAELGRIIGVGGGILGT